MPVEVTKLPPAIVAAANELAVAAGAAALAVAAGVEVALLMAELMNLSPRYRSG
jgi:hypothetical protein